MLLTEQSEEPRYLSYMKAQFQRHLNNEPKILFLTDARPSVQPLEMRNSSDKDTFPKWLQPHAFGYWQQ